MAVPPEPVGAFAANAVALYLRETMAYRFEPAAAMESELRRVADERLSIAIDLLEGLDDSPAAEIEEAVHSVRKRCKEVRGLLRLVRPALGDEFAKCNRLARDAAGELASVRDAHALLATWDELTESAGDEPDLKSVRDRQARSAEQATASVAGDDPRIRRALKLLKRARKRARRWEIPVGFDPLAAGLTLTYRTGRKELRRVMEEPSDDGIHEWRKAVKNLWYQVRLLEGAAPSVLTPLVDRLDDLAESLGDDHDLAVLIERLEADPDAYGGTTSAQKAVKLARTQQADLRRRAFRLGVTLYAERPSELANRFREYWDATLEHGSELAVGGIAELAREDEVEAPAGAATVERERRYLVTTLPELPPNGNEIRQGYLAMDGSVGIRVRDSGESGRTLTIKGGQGAVRTQIEWSIEREPFDAAWKITRDRRIQKTRYQIPYGFHTIELDVFHGSLDGLILAEVEFESDAEMAAFEPPAWFGVEVTEDPSYSNASLAISGLPAPAAETA